MKICRLPELRAILGSDMPLALEIPGHPQCENSEPALSALETFQCALNHMHYPKRANYNNMIRKFVDKVVNAISEPVTEGQASEDREHALRLATAVLMIDVARADHTFDESEFDHILDLIAKHFGLDAEDTANLVVAAHERAEESVSAYEFTKVLHDNLEEKEKARIVSLLWQVAYADGELDKYENSFVLKISDLLHVSRARVMRLKHDAGQVT